MREISFMNMIMLMTIRTWIYVINILLIHQLRII
ncbi:Uncharacterised protein [Klebsiella pneumoniae]|nr:Uncharacterised protein [Salmonella enterica subsp. enterica serovar Typhi]SSM37945.1 Uncharacterised protein [Klebsiella pneumoniae]SSM86002.1 Uncharacterised protein [Klebsiella quasipneumoniae]CGU74242.1 Uncharacterised protein [Salmonella enterica subsp. enterica serovar Typhi]CII68803.1 Uncharacterised protein [Salmonella enterica subsp. enterica serovar Typhi]